MGLQTMIEGDVAIATDWQLTPALPFMGSGLLFRDQEPVQVLTVSVAFEQ